MSERIARIRIALDDIEPEIWRRVDVPLELNLRSLHDVIQAAMGWQDYHVFEFAIADKAYGVPDPDWDFGRKVLQAKLAKLETFVAQGVQEIAYVYDMGDNWRHTITIEAIETGNPGKKYPRFVDGARRGPPEDVGSIPGYYKFLDIMAKPRHREHRRMIEWYGGPYDPDDIDAFHLRLRLGAIAKRRHAGKTAYQKRQAKS
jgi:hypothetical protein